MGTYAILDADNRVVNLIIADEEFCARAYPSRAVCVTGWCDIGASYNPATGEFKAA